MFDFGKILVFSPHRDDECLSCGGLLSEYVHSVHIHYFNSHHPNVSDVAYNAEANKVKEVLCCSVSYSNFMDVNKLDTHSVTEYISEIEGVVNDFMPNTVIIPARSVNQDHRVVHDAALTALRVHDVNWFVNNVLIAEQPETHTPTRTGDEFIPQFFVPIDIEKKLKLYHLYESQVREHRSDHYVRSLAGMRGMQCNSEYAEAYQIVRMVS